MNLRYHKIVPLDTANGHGVRTTLFVTGCHNMPCAPHCFNKDIQSFQSGEPYDDNAHTELISALSKPYIQGLSLLGGEPMLNTRGLVRVVSDVRKRLPEKDVWVWSGFTFEEIMRVRGRRELLGLCDVLVDGHFMPHLYSEDLVFRGSANQRVIDVRESLSRGDVVPLVGFEETPPASSIS